MADAAWRDGVTRLTDTGRMFVLTVVVGLAFAATFTIIVLTPWGASP